MYKSAIYTRDKVQCFHLLHVAWAGGKTSLYRYTNKKSRDKAFSTLSRNPHCMGIKKGYLRESYERTYWMDKPKYPSLDKDIPF